MKVELTHLSFYRFYPIVDPIVLRMQLKSLCAQLELMGTILIAPEGINVGLSGSRNSIEGFKTYANQNLGIEITSFKEAEISEHSYKRMLVKIKKEIITLGIPEIRPDQETGKRLSPADLKQWLDEGRSVILLDTRNDYETAVGSFIGAHQLHLKNFREFAYHAPQLAEKWKDQEVVSFCTGGIRCEKASALLLQLGLKNIYQLEGGILRYLEENGSAHFEGNCFVFDWRLAIDQNLKSVIRSENLDEQFGRHQLKTQNAQSC